MVVCQTAFSTFKYDEIFQNKRFAVFILRVWLNLKKGKIKLHKEMSQVETNSRLVDMNPTISVILLNENGLNTLCKRLGIPD